MITVPESCHNCGELYPLFSWGYSLRGKSGIVDGRHCMGEIQVDVMLGCDTCSETLKIISLDDFLVAADKGLEVEINNETEQ